MSNLDDFLQGIADLRITVTVEEAHLLDWVLTSHTWDKDLVKELQTEWLPLRKKIGKVLTEQTTTIVLSEPERDLLLAITPIIFAIGTIEVGSAVKRKLFETLVGKAEKEAPDAPDKDPSQDTPSPESGPEAA